MYPHICTCLGFSLFSPRHQPQGVPRLYAADKCCFAHTLHITPSLHVSPGLGVQIGSALVHSRGFIKYNLFNTTIMTWWTLHHSTVHYTVHFSRSRAKCLFKICTPAHSVSLCRSPIVLAICSLVISPVLLRCLLRCVTVPRSPTTMGQQSPCIPRIRCTFLRGLIVFPLKNDKRRQELTREIQAIL